MPVRKQGERRAEPGTVPAADKGTAAPRGAVPSAGVVAVTHLCRAQTVSCPPADTQRALRLLQEYRSKLSQAEDRQLRNSIERVIGIFQSNLFQALIGKRCPSSRAGFLGVASCGVGEGKRFAVLSEPSCSSALCVCVCVWHAHTRAVPIGGFLSLTLYEFSARPAQPGSDGRCGASLLGRAVLSCAAGFQVFHVCLCGFGQLIGSVFQL